MDDSSGNERTPLLKLGSAGGSAGSPPAGTWGSRAIALVVMVVATLCIAYGTANVSSIMSSEGWATAIDRSDLFVPTYFPKVQGNIVTNVHAADLPANGANADWDANFVTFTAAKAGVDATSVTVREVVYELTTNAVVTGLDCADSVAMHVFENEFKMVGFFVRKNTGRGEGGFSLSYKSAFHIFIFL